MVEYFLNKDKSFERAENNFKLKFLFTFLKIPTPVRIMALVVIDITSTGIRASLTNLSVQKSLRAVAQDYDDIVK